MPVLARVVELPPTVAGLCDGFRDSSPTMYINEQSIAFPGGGFLPSFMAPGEMLEFAFRKDAAPMVSNFNATADMLVGNLNWGMPGMYQVVRQDSAYMYFTVNGVTQDLTDVLQLGLVIIPHPLNPGIGEVVLLGNPPIPGLPDPVGLGLPDPLTDETWSTVIAALGLFGKPVNDVHVGVIALMGNAAVVMYFNGTEGDQSAVAPDGGSRYERAERFGRKVAVEAWRLYSTIQASQEGPLEFAQRTVPLPAAMAHEKHAETGGQEYGITAEVMSVILYTWLPRSVPVHALRLGDLLIAGVPGEMSAELGLDAKARLRQRGIAHPVIGGPANEWISYMLSEAEYRRGGYEASVSFYCPTLGPLMTASAVETAAALAAQTVDSRPR